MSHELTVKMIAGLREIASGYSALICDVWGVLHNGSAPYPGVIEALSQFRAEEGKHVLLLSNAPRPGTTVRRRLSALGIAESCYDDVLTSGDAARILLTQRASHGHRAVHIGPDKDADLIAGLETAVCDEAQADYILLSGLYDDATQTPDDYAQAIQSWRARDFELVCANPDRLVPMGDGFIYCAGAVAEAYENAGGQVTWLGKPYPLIYQYARERLSSLSNKGSILAIGDGPKTDVLGANQAGLDVLFITGGLGRAQAVHDLQTPDGVAALLAEDGGYAMAAMEHLIW